MKKPLEQPPLNSSLESWGRFPKAEQREFPIFWKDLPFPSSPSPEFSFLPYGQGRSYGDSCLNDQNGLLTTQHLNRFISMNEETGVLCCEAGITLQEILQVMVPRGWFLPVVPGTQFVSLGGAIANDIHGKNHHRAGSFGCHVQQFELLRSDGSRTLCSPLHQKELFYATIGGLGLTGLITNAEIQLKRIESPWIKRETIRFRHLEEFFELAQNSDRDFEYTVGWLDCLSRGNQLGRGVFFRGNHCQAAETEGLKPAKDKIRNFPVEAPSLLLNRYSIGAFNKFYYYTHPSRGAEFVHYRPFFFPLDGITHWNRLYGKPGFVQYQCVVPFEGKQSSIREVIQSFGESGLGSFLTVIKTFGKIPSLGMLSFPRVGVTLCLDLPYEGARTEGALENLDSIVAANGGCVYPAKDARMSKQNFQKYFSKLNEFMKFKDPKFSSSFWRRVT